MTANGKAAKRQRRAARTDTVTVRFRLTNYLLADLLPLARPHREGARIPVLDELTLLHNQDGRYPMIMELPIPNRRRHRGRRNNRDRLIQTRIREEPAGLLPLVKVEKRATPDYPQTATMSPAKGH